MQIFTKRNARKLLVPKNIFKNAFFPKTSMFTSTYDKFQQNVLNRLERIVSIRAITIVSTKRVTDSTAVVCLAVHKERIVLRVYIFFISTSF